MVRFAPPESEFSFGPFQEPLFFRESFRAANWKVSEYNSDPSERLLKNQGESYTRL